MPLVYIGPIFLHEPTPKTIIIYKGVIVITVHDLKQMMVSNK